MIKLTKEQKFYIAKELAPWIPPREILAEFGVPYSTINYHSRKSGIKKYNQNMAEINEEFHKEKEAYKTEMREQGLAIVREKLANETNSKE